MKTTYQKGLHILASLNVSDISLLEKYDAVQEATDRVIETYQLNKLGATYHNFSPVGYTLLICLSESHISMHTWPEHNLVNIDIYLSNNEMINSGKVEEIYAFYLDFFKAKVQQVQRIER
jgi:S-adenosylmethionine decarboxylase